MNDARPDSRPLTDPAAALPHFPMWDINRGLVVGNGFSKPA